MTVVKQEICIVGWHYFNDLYLKLKKIPNVYIVAHRYNKILDDMNFNYSIIKNVGVEFGAYDWYIKNIWDKESNVLFMHDDVVMSSYKDIYNISKICQGYDHVSVKSHQKLPSSGRCLYLSAKIIKLFLKEFKEIWFDRNQRGHVWGEDTLYDDIYYILGDKTKWKDKAGRNYKVSINYLTKKYKLKKKTILYRKFNLYRRGIEQKNLKKILKSNIKKLSDHSLFGIKMENQLEKLACKYKLDRRSEKMGYAKWYDFYFSNIKMENLHILEMSIENESSLCSWKKYFVNSKVYGISTNKIISDNFKIFEIKRIEKSSLKEACKEIPFGIDIVIDNGKYNKDTISNFEFLFSILNPGGIYVIEGLKNRYRKDGNKIINYFKEKIDDINFNGKYENENYEQIIHKDNQKIDFFEKRIASVHFYFGICFIFKRYCK